ncbi:MAG: hypothetical protein AAGH46_05805 [Bacteroidota bacterium]
MKHIFSIFLIFIVLGCSYEPERNTSHSNYDILIRNTDNTGIRWRQHFDDLISSDSLYLFMETGFKDNLLDIYINNELRVQDTISTIGQLGLSEYYTFERLGTSNIGLRIDKGQLLQIELTPEQNIWRVTYIQDSILIAQYSKHAPYYD